MTPYRFSPSIGWFTHLWKSVTRQDHASLRSVLRRLLPSDGVAVDVGAHGGQVTRLLAGLVPQGKVFAIEPSGYARSILRTALWLRGVRNVEIVAGALGAQQGTTTIQTPVKRRGDMGYGLAHIGGSDADRPTVRETVLMTTLDALAATLALSRLDFIKVDIEGYEAAFVEGAMATLGRFRPALLLEHDPHHLARAGTENALLWETLTALGYRPHLPKGDELKAIAAERWPAEGDVFWLHEHRNA